MTVDEVAKATNTDEDLIVLRKLLTSGAKHLPKTLNAYKRLLPERGSCSEGTGSSYRKHLGHESST